MARTTINRDIERKVIGYMLNAGLSARNQQAVAQLQKAISEKFGDAVWNTPPNALHVTLFDWLAPLVEYPENKKNSLRKSSQNMTALYLRQ